MPLKVCGQEGEGKGGRGATCLIVELPVLDGLVNISLTLSTHCVHSHVTCLELLMELCKLLEVVLQWGRGDSR